MSSILKALQKLDNDAGARTEPQPLSRRVDTRKLLGPRPARAPDWRRPAGFVAGCLLLAGLAIFWMQRGFLGTGGPEQPRPVPATGAEQQGDLLVAGRKIVQPAPEPGHPDAAAPTGLSLEQTTAADRQPLAPGANSPALGPQTPGVAAPQPAPAPGRQLEMDKLQAGPLAEQPEERPAPARSKPGDARVGGSSPLTAEGRRGAASRPGPMEKRLGASVLGLQAITWSHNPDGCFALIDNQIVRKGDAVAGYEIVEILEDHVVVAKGGDTWRVEFRHHSP